MISRRGFLLGAPAVVLASNLMPVRDWLRLDPLIRGIRYQTWPFDEERPEMYFQGSISRWSNGSRFAGIDSSELVPASYFINQMGRYTEPTYWQLIW